MAIFPMEVLVCTIITIGILALCSVLMTILYSSMILRFLLTGKKT